jgi:hypothetical protein
MIGLLCLFLAFVVAPFKLKSRLEAENAALRHQLIVLRRKVQGRVPLTNSDRWFFIQLYRWFPSILQVVKIVQPETLVRWHGAGFRSYWRWKSRRRGGRPQIDTDLHALIRRMSTENPLWGAPRIHGELLKLGHRREAPCRLFLGRPRELTHTPQHGGDIAPTMKLSKSGNLMRWNRPDPGGLRSRRVCRDLPISEGTR